MGNWRVDGTSEPGILHLELSGSMSDDDMQKFVKAHNAAIDAFADRDYRVFCDIRTLAALSPSCTEMFAKAKAYSAQRDNFRGSAVWVSSALVAMQHRRTSDDGGVLGTELISENETLLRAHLRAVQRERQSPSQRAARDAQRSK